MTPFELECQGMENVLTRKLIWWRDFYKAHHSGIKIEKSLILRHCERIEFFFANFSGLKNFWKIRCLKKMEIYWFCRVRVFLVILKHCEKGLFTCTTHMSSAEQEKKI